MTRISNIFTIFACMFKALKYVLHVMFFSYESKSYRFSRYKAIKSSAEKLVTWPEDRTDYHFNFNSALHEGAGYSYCDYYSQSTGTEFDNMDLRWYPEIIFAMEEGQKLQNTGRLALIEKIRI